MVPFSLAIELLASNDDVDDSVIADSVDVDDDVDESISSGTAFRAIPLAKWPFA